MKMIKDVITKMRQCAEENELANCYDIHKVITDKLKTWADKIKQAVTNCIQLNILKAKASAALSYPPRNCDVGTIVEQAKRFDVYCHSEGGLCSVCDSCAECVIAWMQMPYEEAKGDAK